MASQQTAQRCGIRKTEKAIIIQLEEPMDLIVFETRWGYLDWRVRYKPPTPFWWWFRYRPDSVYFVCSKKSRPTTKRKRKGKGQETVFNYQAVCEITKDDIKTLSLDYFALLCEECELCRSLEWITDPYLEYLLWATWEVTGISWTLRYETSYVAIFETQTKNVRTYEFDFGRCVDLVPP